MNRLPAASRPHRVLVLAGTRPECLKLVSLVRALRASRAECWLVSSGQHPAMVARTLAQFDLDPDESLPALRGHGSLSGHVRHLRSMAAACLRAERPDIVVVQGDTSTAYAGALAARDTGLPLAHVEAGLRTAHPLRPFPEELFRRRIAPLAQWHFAPTRLAADNLRAEGIANHAIHQVGNTGVDLLRFVLEAPRRDQVLLPDWRNRFQRLITLTLHRRENYGARLDLVCEALLELLARHVDLGVVCPLHPNPAVANRLRRLLGTHPRVLLTDALPYRPFVQLLSESTLVVTDSGGIQEEAPYLGVPVLVTRENTERPESANAGHAHLVPAHPGLILERAGELLDAPRPVRVPFTPLAPFGDGRAGERITQQLVGARDSETEGDGVTAPALTGSELPA